MQDKEFVAPDTTNSHLELAYVLQNDESYEAALDACDAAIERARILLADAYNLRGIILEELDRSDDAEEAYRLALDTDPGLQEAADNLRDLQADGIADEMVTMANFASVAEAYLAHGRLEVEGIWSFVADEYAAITVGPAVSGGSRLMVRTADLERAREILGLDLPDEDDWEDELDDKDDDDTGYEAVD